VYEDSVTFLQNLNADCDHGFLVMGNVFIALAPFNVVLFEKTRNGQQPLLV